MVLNIVQYIYNIQYSMFVTFAGDLISTLLLNAHLPEWSVCGGEGKRKSGGGEEGGGKGRRRGKRNMWGRGG